MAGDNVSIMLKPAQMGCRYNV